MEDSLEFSNAGWGSIQKKSKNSSQSASVGGGVFFESSHKGNMLLLGSLSGEEVWANGALASTISDLASVLMEFSLLGKEYGVARNPGRTVRKSSRELEYTESLTPKGPDVGGVGVAAGASIC